METKLNQLAKSLSTTGQWTWWAAKFPVALQLEFDHAQLYFGERCEPLKPSNKVALAFYKPISVTFLQRGEVEDNWAIKLSADMINGFHMTSEMSGFNDYLLFRKLLKEASQLDNSFGCEPLSKAFREANIQFGFWAGKVGVILAAESMRIFNLDGEIALDEVSKYAEDWMANQVLENSLEGLPINELAS